MRIGGGYTISVVDVAEQAREAFGACVCLINPNAPDVDWRFEIVTPTQARATMHSGATAEDVAAYVEQDRNR